MFLPRISRPSCASGWLAASQAVQAMPGHEAHNVIIDIDDPLIETEQDRQVTKLVDAYLTRHTENEFLVRTVANTIFPQAVFDDHGSPAFYDVYIKRIFPKLKRSSQDWGRYFERMMAYPTGDETDNLLDILVQKMKRNVEGKRPFRNVYELPIYNPVKDAEGRLRGGQCLSFMSFKLDGERRLLLTAMYRNHYYTEKLLGNLVGLGRLMKFVADEVGIPVGSLTIVSTHAEVDVGSKGSQNTINELFDRCDAVYEATASRVA